MLWLKENGKLLRPLKNVRFCDNTFVEEDVESKKVSIGIGVMLKEIVITEFS